MADNRYRPGRNHTSKTAPVVPPIYQTTTFELDDTSYDDIQGTGGLHATWYSRFNTRPWTQPQRRSRGCMTLATR